MIKVTVELVSALGAGRNKTWSAKIWNDRTTSVESGGRKGAYEYEIIDAAGSVWKSGKIHNFPRKQRGVWDLLFRVLLNAVGNRNGEWTREETK